jgi:hypothetical protein
VFFKLLRSPGNHLRVSILRIVKKIQNHCTLMFMLMLMARTSNGITKLICEMYTLDAMLRDICGKGRVGLI